MGAICSETLRLCVKNPADPEELLRQSELKLVQKQLKSMETMKKLYNISDTVLGVGSFGKVYLAESTTNPAIKFSVKVVSKELLGENSDWFKDVYNLLKNLDHPNILKYYDFFENDANYYLVMEMFEGQQLLDLIISNANNNKGWMPESTAKEILK